MTDNWKVLEELERSEEPCLLATIIHVDGSAYRKVGSSMLVKASGGRVGMLSGGCVEQDVAARTEEMLRSGRSVTFNYNTRSSDDPIGDFGSGCEGRIHVLLEPIGDALRRQLTKIKEWLVRGVSVAWVRRLDAHRTVVEHRFLPEWEFHSAGLDESPLNGCRYDGSWGSEVFVQVLSPKPRLLILGAGEDARPLAAMASQVGFAVTVADWRQALCCREHFPSAERLVIGFPADISSQIRLGEDDYAVVMTHHYEHDKQLLEWLLDRSLRYVGVLGPRHRTERLLAGQPLPEAVHSPVGLPIGAAGPDEIAVSIVAELIRMRRAGASSQPDKPPTILKRLVQAGATR
ncbi:MAG: xanthine dehydrogenase [Paenibacillaceae bacterium]|jgi:xanthine dehydrogenase accessory factor|nr:xanthine dehydrogenase [Paenibacillaceae bacterium]